MGLRMKAPQAKMAKPTQAQMARNTKMGAMGELFRRQQRKKAKPQMAKKAQPTQSQMARNRKMGAMGELLRRQKRKKAVLMSSFCGAQ
jgi:hypothetical protein